MFRRGALYPAEHTTPGRQTRHEELALTKFRIKSHLGQVAFNYENVFATHAKKHLQKAARIQQALTDVRILIMDDRLERHFSRAEVTDFSHRTKQVESWRELAAAANLDYRKLLADSLCFFRAWQKLASVKVQHAPRSNERREAQRIYVTEVAGANVTISKEQLFAIAQHYAARVDEYNLFFGSRIADPTLEENQMKVWNATFGYFGLPLRKFCLLYTSPSPRD